VETDGIARYSTLQSTDCIRIACYDFSRKQIQLGLIATFCVTMLLVVSQIANANPIGGNVMNGSASFATTGNTLTVTNTPGTIINWQGFSINSNEVTRFAQQSAASTVLNRVVGSDPSNIMGTLQSNGRVFLINPNGILFGAGAVVDVAGLMASTLNLSDADFLAGNHHYTQVPGAGNISNAGNIRAQQGGQIYLIAPNVENTGVITAPNGEILLAAGYSVDLVSTDNPDLRVNITAPAGDATNVGQLIAASGSLGLFGTVVSNGGIVSADSATLEGGKIVFKASRRAEAGGTISANGTSGGSVDISAAHSLDPNAPGVVIQTGSIAADGTAGAGGSVSINADSILSTAAIDADGTAAGGQISMQASDRALSTASAQFSASSTEGQGGDILVSADVSNYTSGSYSATGVTGGNITMAGNEIKLAAAQLDASGMNGGGTIHVGGLMQGAAGFVVQGTALTNSTNVLVNSATTLKADALQTGNGGEVVLWSDQAMGFTGSISAKGGAISGNGGSAEVSGLTSFGYGGLTDLSAVNGSSGTLLLDPYNITIVAGSGPSAGTPYTEILDPTPGAGEGFGGLQNLVLGNGNIVVASPLDSALGPANSGAVYLYNPAGSLVSALVGSAAGDKVGADTFSVSGTASDVGGLTLLSNDNLVISSNNWSGGFGAVTWMNGTTGALTTGSIGGTVSLANSLVGGSSGDRIGTVSIPYCCGVNDQSGITTLANGNLLIASNNWNGGFGAVTWMNGATGVLSDGGNGGGVSSLDSLVGSAAGDNVGSGGITELTDNSTFWNAAVRSEQWGSGGTAANALGAVTWINGATGALSDGSTGAAVSASNSLIGATAGDKIGTTTLTSNTGTPYSYDVTGIASAGIGNLIITSDNWQTGGAAVGAVTWMNGATGELADSTPTFRIYGGTVSTSNSLIGSTAGDKVGVNTLNFTGSPYTYEQSGITYINGNVLIGSNNWSGTFGAVTWMNGNTGALSIGATGGAISSSNSLVGTSNGDKVGGSITALTNGNAVVVASSWSTLGGVLNVGAVTWINGASGALSDGNLGGSISGSNSLIGSSAGDKVGTNTNAGTDASGLTILGNDNLLIASNNWSGTFGAVSWMNGKTGRLSDSTTGGAVSSQNSLVGTTAGDKVGSTITPLLNGNVVVVSSNWTQPIGASPTPNVGAVTWMNGSSGVLSDGSSGGAITVANSLIGSKDSDQVGSGGITQISDGIFFNYLVNSSLWNGGTTATALGAVTWVNGSTGLLSDGSSAGGIVSGANSLIGSTAGDQTGVGNGTVQLANGNVLIHSIYWTNTAGAMTWMNGATGKLSDGNLGGAIAASNSLLGNGTGDNLGSGGVTQLGNGMLVIASPYWSVNGLSTSEGAATWMDSTSGKLLDSSTGGVITATNSLIGGSPNDRVGSDGVTEVTDYSTFWNYVVRSSGWNSGAGAVTWVNGTTGKTSDGSGTISSANSLIGSSAGDSVGSDTVKLLGNGTLVLADQFWGGGKGAVTWMDGATGKLADNSQGGVVSATNSLIGSTTDALSPSSTGDRIGSGGITEITDGATFWNYVVASPFWVNGGTLAGAGAVTLGNGKTGTAGLVAAGNSLVGTKTGDGVGSGGITPVSNGSFWNYVVSSPDWGSLGVYQSGMGAVTWMNGVTGVLSNGATAGAVSTANSLTGSLAGDQIGVASTSYSSGLFGVNAESDGNLLIRSQHWNGDFSALTWMNGASGKLSNGATGGTVSAANSLLGSTQYDNLGGGIVGLTALRVSGNWVITSPDWGGNGQPGMGAVTWMNSSNGQLADGSYGGVVSAANSLVGSSVGDVVGGDYFCDCSYVGGITELSDGNYIVNSPYWGSGGGNPTIGAVSWGNGATGTAGIVSSGNSVFALEMDITELVSQPGAVLIGSSAANGGAGGVYLLGVSPTGVSGYLFTDSPSTDAIVGADWIASFLNTGSLVLQANNDLTQSAGADIIATGSGSLTMQAGHSMVLDGAINIRGSLDISANDPGAVLTGGGGVLDASLANLTASKIRLINYGGDVTIGTIQSGSGGVDVVAVNGNFISASGSATPVSSSGMVSIYSTDPAKDTLNGMSSNFHRYNCTYAAGCLTPGTVVPSTGTGFFYSLAPVLTVTANAATKTYGTPDASVLTYSAVGFIGSDTAANSLMTGSLAHTGGENVGTGYTITQGTLVNQMGYGITLAGGNTLSITPATLTLAANDASKILNTADPPLTYSVSGLQFTDTATSTGLTASLTRAAGETVGTYPISFLSAGLTSTNYILNLVGADFTILVPTVINQIVDTTNQDRKPTEEILASAFPTGEEGNTQSLPMCN
jgi:filamentous hemagglutinin family protein